MNTGSLDGYKSIYDEEIKLEDGNDSFRLAYNQWRYEDKVVLDIENELDFIFSPTKTSNTGLWQVPWPIRSGPI